MPRNSGATGTETRRKSASQKELNESLSISELLKRLKTIAHKLSDTEQLDDIEAYGGIAASLIQPFIIHHKDKDVKILAACCLLDILRIYAPEAPYNRDQLKDLFSLVIDQMKGLKNPKGPSFKRYFYILENAALVRSFTICSEMDFQDLILELFKTMFSVVNEGHSSKLKNLMLDVMSSLIQEGDSIPNQLLDVIFSNIVEPTKSENADAYQLASDLIQRCAAPLEPYVQMFFNNALFLGQNSESELSQSFCEVIYELHKISSTVLLSVIPQLEYKVKSNDEEERLEVTRLLAKMFSDKDSDLATQNAQLWKSYLGRFLDINPGVRIECVKHAKYFLVYHPNLAADVADKLHERQRDNDEKVRQEFVKTVCEAAAENLSSIPDQLFEDLKERLRDKKIQIRKEAVTCLAKLYRKAMADTETWKLHQHKLDWIPNKILYNYYQNTIEDRLWVERVMFGCLVPGLDTAMRMKSLVSLYYQLDEKAITAFQCLLKCQSNIRKDFSELLSLIRKDKNDETEKLISSKVIMLARILPEPFKAQENLKKLVSLLEDKKMVEMFEVCVNCDCGVKEVWKAVGEIVVKLGSKNVILDTVKALLDRVAPVLVDQDSIKFLFSVVKKTLDGDDLDDSWDDSVGINPKAAKGFKLLATLASVYPKQFKSPECFQGLLVFLKHKDRTIVDTSIRILSQTSEGLDESNKSLAVCFQPLLVKMAVKGTPQQAKFVMQSITKIFKDSTSILERIFESLLENLEYDSPFLLTALSSLGHLAVLSPSLFDIHHKRIVKDFVVKNLLVKDRDENTYDSENDDEWCEDVDVTKETQAKVLGIKLLVRWLLGLESNHAATATPVLRLLHTMLSNDGDLQAQGHVTMCDRSRLRLTAACGVIKIAQAPAYIQAINQDMFQQLSLTMQDTCYEVREAFTIKLHKGLSCLKLPLEYMTLLSLAASEPCKDRKTKVKQMIERNITTRRNYLKQHSVLPALKYTILPEYSLPYLVYLLAHHPDHDNKSVESLRLTKEYLWFFMEPLMHKADNFSFLKKLLENIKQTKDAHNSESTEANEAIYSVCDLAIGLILNKPSVLVLKNFPGNPVLPQKLFVPMDKSIVNSKIYLPKEFQFTIKKRIGQLEMKNQSSAKTNAKNSKKAKENVSRKTNQIKKTQKQQQEDTEESSSESDVEDSIPLKKLRVDSPVKKESSKRKPAAEESPLREQSSRRKRGREEETVEEESEQTNTKTSLEGSDLGDSDKAEPEGSEETLHSVTQDSLERVSQDSLEEPMEQDEASAETSAQSPKEDNSEEADDIVIKRRSKRRR